MSKRFPPGFLWGAATSAHRIEGSPLADGAGPSIWHRFSRQPGATHRGETADVTCDHYRRWEGDVELMRELGWAPTVSACREDGCCPRAPAG